MANINLPTSTPTHPDPLTMKHGTSEWRCLECGKLLGIRCGGRLHIRMAGHDYEVNLPAEAICRNCNAYNRT